MRYSFFIFKMSEGKGTVQCGDFKSQMLRPILPISLDYYEDKLKYLLQICLVLKIEDNIICIIIIKKSYMIYLKKHGLSSYMPDTVLGLEIQRCARKKT